MTALSSQAGNTTAVQLNTHTLTVSQTTQVNAGATLAVTGGGNLAAGSVNNAGTFKLDHGTAVFSGTFTNSRACISDPSTQTFSTMLTTSTGTIQASAGKAAGYSEALTPCPLRRRVCPAVPARPR